MSTNFGFSYQLPVIQAMGKYPQIKIRITLEPIGSSTELTDPVEREYFKRYFIPLKSARFQKWHYRIGTSNFRTAFFQDTIGVQLPHGVAAGNNRHSIDRAQHHASNIIFYPSQRCKGIISRDKPATWDDNHRIFFSTGAPKLDPLIRKQFSREKTLEELGLSPGRKTILIGSYWSPRSLLRTWRSDLLIRLASAFPDCNIIQTAHEHIWTDSISDIMPNPRKDLPRFDSEKLMAELRRAERLHCNIRVRRASNIGPLMNAADLFIGDYSSSLVEFSLLDRPILFLIIRKSVFTTKQCTGSIAKPHTRLKIWKRLKPRYGPPWKILLCAKKARPASQTISWNIPAAPRSGLQI